jgi:hypothetical protein
MMIKILVGVIFAIVTTFSHAEECERVGVTVLPFEYREDHSMAFKELSSVAGGRPTFGAVMATFSATAKDCEITLGYNNVVLRVARELTTNECTFAHVRKHELRHIEIYKERLKGILARINERVEMGMEFQEAIMIDLFETAMEHRAHDSPEEYATNTHACGGKVFELTGVR